MEYKWQILLYCSNKCHMACIQCQFSFWRALPNLFKFELKAVCKVIMIIKCILWLRKTSRHRKTNTMEYKWQILLYCSNKCQMACIQGQFSFRQALPNLFKCELNAVCKVITNIKCILWLRNTSRHRSKGIMRANVARGKRLLCLCLWWNTQPYYT